LKENETDEARQARLEAEDAKWERRYKWQSLLERRLEGIRG
jgi:hypothetical protein